MTISVFSAKLRRNTFPHATQPIPDLVNERFDQLVGACFVSVEYIISSITYLNSQEKVNGNVFATRGVGSTL